jgi:hypothetical protein
MVLYFEILFLNIIILSLKIVRPKQEVLNFIEEFPNSHFIIGKIRDFPVFHLTS